MLLDIIDKVEINKNYRKSDTLQVMRILKKITTCSRMPSSTVFSPIAPRLAKRASDSETSNR